MGRTVPTLTQELNELETALQRFRRTLRRSDQELLDSLLASARRHLAAIAESGVLLPFEGVLLAMLLEQSRRLTRLEHEVADLRAELAAWRDPHGAA